MATARSAVIDCEGRRGRIGGWEGPDTPDGSPHVVYADRAAAVRCPCGWEHRLVGGEVRSWGLAMPEPAPEPSARCARCGHGDGRSYGHGLPAANGGPVACESMVPTGAYYDAGRVYGIDRIPQRWEGRTRCPCPAFVPPKGEP